MTILNHLVRCGKLKSRKGTWTPIGNLGSFTLLLNVGICLLLLIFASSPSIGRAAFPGGNGKIAYSAYRYGGVPEIHVINADGSNETRLTFIQGSSDLSPTWSPDGTKIAFTSDRDGFPNSEIYVMNADGSNQMNVTNDPAQDHLAAWSPDGSKIVFHSNRDGNFEIYVIDANGNNPIRLTNDPANDFAPVWSPDGSKIAFQTNRNGNSEIYLMDASGNNPTNLTNHASDDGTPDWSPDGSKIAFTSNRDSNEEIYVMGADGSNQTRLTNNSVADSEPSWSPDGTKIVFQATDTGILAVYTMNANGSGRMAITNGAIGDGNPDWQPVDVTPPMVNVSFPLPNGQNGWFATSPVVGSVAADDTTTGGSNITAISCTGATVGSITGLGTPNASASLTVSTEGVNNVSCTATDSAGNSGAAAGSSNTATIKIDTTVPTFSCAMAPMTWSAGDVSRTCTANDGGSGLATTANFLLTTSVPNGTETADALTGAADVCDNAGNCVTAGPLGGNMVDKQAPSISCSSADTNWHAENQSVTCTAIDGGSGPASQNLTLNTSVTPGDEADSVFTNSESVCDVVGNCATAGPVGSFKIDRKGPTVTCTATPTYLLNQAGATASGTVTDGGSGPATSPVSVPVSTSVVGSFTASVTGFDNVGNSTIANCPYNVIYDFSGFFSPVDNPGPGPTFVFNSMKAGSATPMKFSLSGDHGLNIFAAGYPKSEKVDCNSAGSLDDIEETVTAGGSGLNYDAILDQYNYVWKTDKGWPNTCRKLIVRLIEGTDHVAYFKFK